MRIYRRVSKKKYHNKALYEYERFFVPVPKRYHDFVRPFTGKDVKVKVESVENGFVLKVQLRSPPNATSR